MKQRRWKCPRCDSGVLAPGKPRKDDVRRYCLPCSEETGRLVARVCPSLEAERLAKKHRLRDQRTQRIERERQRETEHHTVAGIDVRAEWTRLCKLPFVRERLREKGVRGEPKLTIHWSKTKSHVTGHCNHWGDKVHLGVWEGVDRGEIFSLIAHELAHAVAPLEEHHGDGWRRTYMKIVAEAYGLPEVVGLPRTVKRAWVLDRRVQDAIEEAERGGVDVQKAA